MEDITIDKAKSIADQALKNADYWYKQGRVSLAISHAGIGVRASQRYLELLQENLAQHGERD